MKETTIKRINTTVINYLSLVGLLDGKAIDQNNSVSMYFMVNILYNRQIDVVDNEPTIISTSLLEDEVDLFNINISNSFFHSMVREFDIVYDKLHEIKNKQNEEIREMLINFVGNKYDFDKYIDIIISKYKHSFYELVRYYNSNNPEYTEIRLKLLNDKMMEHVESEQYENAAQVRDVIINIKEKGK